MKLLNTLRVAGALFAAMSFGQIAHASNNPAMDAQVTHINEEWARIRFRIKDNDAQYPLFDALAQQAGAVAARYPNYAEPLMWQGIITSEEARTASMFKRMGYATTARDLLEKARKINPNAANGGVLMSLGVLYYRVPGFPIGLAIRPRPRPICLPHWRRTRTGWTPIISIVTF